MQRRMGRVDRAGLVFIFKQKTAYEMRISDWSSDVCSSDLPSQALFAETVLAGTGMQARVVGVSSEVMATMEQFRPDLVLTDLHMPGLSGAEITALIRAHVAFAHTPIVFLTGDPDPERSEEHTSELQSLMRISYAVFCLKKKNNTQASSANTKMKK